VAVTRYFLGVDIGATKTHALIAGETGVVVGFGQAGPGNHETVGYPGLAAALDVAVTEALAAAGLTKEPIAGAGFGVAGYDWPSEREPTLRAIGSLGLCAPVEAVNDTILGLVAGATEGWGIAVVSGTGCNCRGWDRHREREGQVTGHGLWMGEAAGASELVFRALQVIAQAWTRRGPPTKLSAAFADHTGLHSIEEMLEQLTTGQLELHADAAPLVFQVAAQGDPVAMELVRWAGCELGELACAVIRQLEFEALAFDVVLVGSMFDAGPDLIEPMRQTIRAVAPGAHLVRLTVPPVIGAVLLGMEQAGLAGLEQREALIHSARRFLPG
jgi:N-acetylglucosamine kinase-like BadF-type ATPase